MRVIVGCEFSGVVREAFRARGHDAVSCDLLPAADDSRHHIHGDVVDALASGGGWDLGIFHPPCTYLCSSGLHWNTRPQGIADGRPAKTEAAVAFVRMLLTAPIPRIALENPIGRIGTAIRPADQIIQPYEYGHDASKRTALWLKGLPKLRPTVMVAGKWACAACARRWPQGEPNGNTCTNCGQATKRLVWGNQTCSGQNSLGPSDDRWALRAETYTGIAAAMAEQWTSDGPADGVLF